MLLLTFNVKAGDELKQRGLLSSEVKTFTSYQFGVYKARARPLDKHCHLRRTLETRHRIACMKRRAASARTLRNN